MNAKQRRTFKRAVDREVARIMATNVDGLAGKSVEYKANVVDWLNGVLSMRLRVRVRIAWGIITGKPL